MYRKMYQNLIEWKQSAYRKPLLLQGARQIGKTYLVNQFAKEQYANYVYCNFEKEEALHAFFQCLAPGKVVEQIARYKRKEIIPGQTLLIFDEIQACPRALTSLKYFHEDGNEYHVIATGSLLGVAVNREAYSFPVGKVDMLSMYPMDFEEFLLAKGGTYAQLAADIREAYQADEPLLAPLHEMALEMYREFLYVGGMPEVVREYVETANLELCRIVQKNILEAYFRDMSKYNKATEIPKTKLVFQNIPTQLSKENRKFQYRYLKSGGRAAAYEDALSWVCTAGIAYQLRKLERVALPLNSQLSLSDFKLYLNDVGLCCALGDVFYEDIAYELNDFTFRGGLTENYVHNQLIGNQLRPYYWMQQAGAEVDFVVRIGLDVIPIEVKSGVHTRSKSLDHYRKTYQPAYAIRISAKNFGFEDGIKSVPLYAAFCINT